MPGTSQALRKLAEILDQEHVPNMLIGGFALPAYGRIRATLDLDIAVAAPFPDVVRLHSRLAEHGYQLPPSPNERAPLFVMTDLQNRVEIEVWTKPDGVTFDDELLQRRVRVRPFDDDFEMFAIGPEDFIVNKLSRKDRGVQDEMDVVSVLRRQKGKLDHVYLSKRAEAADVTGLLEMLATQVT